MIRLKITSSFNIYIDFTIFCLKMSIQIGNASNQGKNLYKQTNNNYGWITSIFYKSGC